MNNSNGGTDFVPLMEHPPTPTPVPTGMEQVIAFFSTREIFFYVVLSILVFVVLFLYIKNKKKNEFK